MVTQTHTPAARLDVRLLARQLVGYAVFGGAGALTDLCVYFLLVRGLDSPAVGTNVVSVCCGISVSFLLNSRFNFKRTDRPTVRMMRFFTVGLSGLVLSTVLLAVLVRETDLVAQWAKLLTIPPVTLLQFLLNRGWTFSHLHPRPRETTES